MKNNQNDKGERKLKQTGITDSTYREMAKNSLVTPSHEEIKKQELIGVLAGLIKNYAEKKRQQ